MLRPATQTKWRLANGCTAHIGCVCGAWVGVEYPDGYRWVLIRNFWKNVAGYAGDVNTKRYEDK